MKKLASQWLKTKGSPLRWLLVILPLIFSIGLGSYLGFRKGEFAKGEVELMVITLLTISGLFFSAIFIYLIVDIEKSNHHFFQEKRQDVKRNSVFMSKLVLICAVAIWFYLATLIIFVFFWKLMTGEWLALCLLLKMGLISYLFLLPMLSLYIWLSYLFSINVTVIVAAFTMLSGILLGTTGLGATLWKYVPLTWSLRFTELYLLERVPSIITFMSEYRLFFASSLLLTFVIFVLQLIWYNQGEEKKSLGD
ncbi:hypothetical protein [Vagococcus sp.]|uniref:hypothetical protein n=1 Tax=Vagococcus sp. TaxID=1933889 RepID=UPI003F95FD92